MCFAVVVLYIYVEVENRAVRCIILINLQDKSEGKWSLNSMNIKKKYTVRYVAVSCRVYREMR